MVETSDPSRNGKERVAQHSERRTGDTYENKLKSMSEADGTVMAHAATMSF
jgi:hypothetical protein